MKVVEIFKSIEGEGKRAGLPCTFVRLFGCNLKCKYCDTPYGWAYEYKDDAKEMSADDIIAAVDAMNVPNVTITGGEPLLQDYNEMMCLLSALSFKGYDINVETNGTMMPLLHSLSNIFYTVDYKTDASGMSSKMDMNVMKSLSDKDVLKFVVGSIDDCKQAKCIIDSIKTEAAVYFSPVFGMIEPKDIVKFLLDNNMYNCHVQVQLHKIIWPADMRGV